MTAPYVHESSYADEGVAIGDDTKVWHFCHIQSGASIGRGCSLGQNVYVGANAKIGDGVKIQNNVSVYEGVELGDHVFCGPSCVFTNDLTPRAKYPKGGDGYKRTVVRRGASIGANATIVCGHEIGAWAMVGSGAVVTSDVPPHARAGRSGAAARMGVRMRSGPFGGPGVQRLREDVRAERRGAERGAAWSFVT